MESDIENIANFVRDLSIVGEAGQDHQQESLRSTRNHLASLQNAIKILTQSTSIITLEAQYFKSMDDKTNSSGDLPIMEVCSLHKKIKELVDIVTSLTTTIDTLNGTTENSIIARLKSLGTQSATIMFERQPPIQGLFLHFDKAIRNIIQKVLNDHNGQDLLWKIAEECYIQAANSSGILHADDYFIPLREACLQWPYDPDFESEEYYEHENRLEVDEHYRTDFGAQVTLRDQTHRKDWQDWVSFWVRVLNKTPAGPTLFYPPASSRNQSLNLDSTPQYLFRTFDEASSGRNDESTIASMASISRSHESSRIDILTLEKHRAAKLLHMHLTKSCFSGEKSDNLVSWTSSLLFAIQYAVWRLRHHRCSPSYIKICTVDTKKFPQGQFARDIWLFKTCESATEHEDKAQKFFKFRIGDERYYNGEYLSQGAVNHTNRSYVVSLEQLIQAGLFKLYPEFDSAEGSEKWASRVLELRQNWSTEQGTTDQEIQLALQIGNNCFGQSVSLDIAFILLAFKNRRYSKRAPIETRYHSNKQGPEWADKPYEVRRYWVTTQAANSYGKFPHASASLILQQHQKMLREIFD